MVYPVPLKKGDTVAIVGVSGVAKGSCEEIKNTIVKKLDFLGLKAKIHPSVFEQYGYLSGKDEMRAKALMDAFLDDEVQGVFCAKGGYGVLRMLDFLDFDLIKQNPKVFIGYSDITALHLAIAKKCGFVSFHGPMPVSDAMELQTDTYTINSLWQSISASSPLGEIHNPKEIPFKVLNKGKAKGLLTGGNLTLVTHTLGTAYEIDTKGKILFLEDIGEKTYAVDRMLSHLKLAGKLEDCAGIVLGGFTDCPVEDKNYGLTLDEIFADILLPLQKPIIFQVQAGHVRPKMTLVLGGKYLLDADQGKFSWIK